MDQSQLDDFATRYAEAWSSQNPDNLVAFYETDGSLTVNSGDPAVGRDAVRGAVASFMTAFPDMIVQLDAAVHAGSRAIFHWTWTGTNTGPGGTGRGVRISGHEEWTFGPHGLLEQSLGHYDEVEYKRQMDDSTPT